MQKTRVASLLTALMIGTMGCGDSAKKVEQVVEVRKSPVYDQDLGKRIIEAINNLQKKGGGYKNQKSYGNVVFESFAKEICDSISNGNVPPEILDEIRKIGTEGMAQTVIYHKNVWRSTLEEMSTEAILGNDINRLASQALLRGKGLKKDTSFVVGVDTLNNMAK